MEDEVREVIKLIKKDFKKVHDYDVRSQYVNLLDKNDKIIARITSDQLTDYWNLYEGFVTVKGK